MAPGYLSCRLRFDPIRQNALTPHYGTGKGMLSHSLPCANEQRKTMSVWKRIGKLSLWAALVAGVVAVLAHRRKTEDAPAEVSGWPNGE